MDLQSIAQVCYDQIYGNNTAQNAIKVEHFIEVAKSRYAYELWLQSKTLGRSEGEWEVPSSLLREENIEVKDNEADISSLNIFRSFDGDAWIQNIGGFDCECSYVKQSVNINQMLCDDEYLQGKWPFVIVGKKIKFPKGAHTKILPIIYATNGTDIENEIEVDDAVGDLVSDYLFKRFSGKLPVDRTNDDNENK